MRAFELARHGFVLEGGRVTLHGAASELARNPAVREAYMGLAS
jgi:branched-chain amino acid transport system ATP-binding protein